MKTATSATAVVSYTYDAWGSPLATTGTLATTLGTLNPLRYRGYVYDTETGFYYLQSRYYDPEIGRFINSDIYIATGQGMLGNNMFAYCRNNPVSRKDASGTDDVRVTDANDDDNPLNDLGTYYGNGGASGGGYSQGGSNTQTTSSYSSGNQQSSSGYSSYTNEGPGTSETSSKYKSHGRTEIHHVVEQCQQKKSGFSRADLQADSNKIELPYSVHRQISAYYSSKKEFTNNLRVRDWLAGQSFDFQSEFGWKIIWKFLLGE